MSDILDVKINAKHQIALFLIKKFLKQPPSNYAREMAIAKKIIKNAPEVLEIELNFKLNSLAWFLTRPGIECINKHNFKNRKVDNTAKPAYIPPKKESLDLAPRKKTNLEEFLN